MSDVRRVLFVDGLRGLAASYVVISHCWSTVFPAALAIPTPTVVMTAWMGLGRYAVALFIVLSGYSLGLVLWRHEGRWPGGVVAFLRGRFRRIVPTYWAAVAIASALGLTVLSQPIGTLWDGAIPIRPSGLITHGLLVQDVYWAGPAGSTAFWSLAIEFHIYLALAAVLVLTRLRMGWWPALFALAGVLTVAGALVPGNAVLGVVAGMQPGLYGLFVLGLVAARLALHPDADARRRFHRFLGVAGAVGLVAAAATSIDALDPVAPVHDLWFGPLAVYAVSRLSAAGSSGLAAAVVRTLGRPRLVWLGTISYSLYLTHAFVIEIVFRAVTVRLGEPGPAMLAVQVLLGLAASIAFAALFYRVVERRFVSRAHDRAGTVAVQRRRLALSWRRRPSAAPTTEPVP
ncbi:acyltransferase family protein [Solicola sp. PLA-1-18]|uniref:acyltransferase family protein n=1 Tax=Solicola sp. PLA-1-18 TaxID=3380532 RepID=UPI003B7853EF